MSQPTEGPQPQRTWTETLDWIASQPQPTLDRVEALGQLKQEEFDRLIKQAQKVPLKDRLNEKVSNVTSRVHAVYDRESQRLGAMAQQLQSQAGQYLQAGQQWAGQQVERGAAFRDRQVNRATEFGGRQMDRAAEFTNRQMDRAAELGQQAVGAYQTGVEAAGRGLRAGQEWAGQQVDRAAEFGSQQVDRAVAFGGRQVDRAAEFGNRQVDRAADFGNRAMEAGRGMVDRASRWVNTQKTRVSIAADGARATIAAARFDRNMPGATTKDLAQLSQQHSRIMSGPTLEARLEAAQKVTQQLQSQVDARTQAQALGGLAPAGGAVNPSQGNEAQAAEQGSAVNLQKTDNNKGIGKG